jgi:hypothetical protein
VLAVLQVTPQTLPWTLLKASLMHHKVMLALNKQTVQKSRGLLL